jgi:hypothetical protein
LVASSALVVASSGVGSGDCRLVASAGVWVAEGTGAVVLSLDSVSTAETMVGVKVATNVVVGAVGIVSVAEFPHETRVPITAKRLSMSARVMISGDKPSPR